MNIILDQNKVTFLQGVLAAHIANGLSLNYMTTSRYIGVPLEHVGSYLGAARAELLKNGAPDFCAAVIGANGKPGSGWGDPSKWKAAWKKAHKYWSDRISMNKADFITAYGACPPVPVKAV
jgi:hypothetical protein